MNAYRVVIYTERGLNAYDELKRKANFRERKILSTYEKYLFREEEEVIRGTLPFIIRVECLNFFVAKKINFPEPIKTAYKQLGCKEGVDFDVVKVW